MSQLILLNKTPEDGGDSNDHLSTTGLASMFRKENPSDEDGSSSDSESPTPDDEETSEQSPDTDGEDDRLDTDDEVAEEEDEPADEAEDSTSSGDDDDTGDGDHEAEPEDSRTVSKLQKRIHSLADQRDAERNQRIETERRLEAMEAKLAGRDSSGAAPGTAPDPQLGGNLPPATQEIAAIDRNIAWFNQFQQWADENPDGGTFTPTGGKPLEVSPEHVEPFVQEAKSSLPALHSERAVKAHDYQKTQLAAQQESHDKAVQLYPWLTKKDSPEFSEGLRIIQANPSLLSMPDHELLVGRMVEGGKVEKTRSAGGRKKTTKRGVRRTSPVGDDGPAPVVVRPGAARRKTKDSESDEAHQDESNFAGSGKFSDLKNMFASQHRARKRSVRA